MTWMRSLRTLLIGGLDPAKQETYSNGVLKVTYSDADGNEIGFGGAPR